MQIFRENSRNSGIDFTANFTQFLCDVWVKTALTQLYLSDLHIKLAHHHIPGWCVGASDASGTCVACFRAIVRFLNEHDSRGEHRLAWSLMCAQRRFIVFGRYHVDHPPKTWVDRFLEFPGVPEFLMLLTVLVQSNDWLSHDCSRGPSIDAYVQQSASITPLTLFPLMQYSGLNFQGRNSLLYIQVSARHPETLIADRWKRGSTISFMISCAERSDTMQAFFAICDLNLPVTTVCSLQLQLECWTKPRTLSCFLATVRQQHPNALYMWQTNRECIFTRKKPSQDPRKPKYSHAVFPETATFALTTIEHRQSIARKGCELSLPRYRVQQKVCKPCYDLKCS